MPRLAVSSLAGALVLILSLRSSADVRLPALIGDNMVVQHGQPARLWGWADAGERVVVRASWHNSPVQTTAGADGRWSVDVPTPDPGGPFTVTIAGNNEITLHDVLVGEVWVCSGQSNMQMCIRENGIWHGGALNWEAEVAAADYPQIRFFAVERRIAAEPQTDCGGAWTVCRPETAAEFSAAAYFFGRTLHQELDVPIGLIHTSWGGTRAEAWTSHKALAAVGDYAGELAEPIVAPTPENSAQHAQAAADRERQRFLLDARNQGFAKGYADREFDAGSWPTMDVPGRWESLGPDMQVDGVVWMRRDVTVPQSWAGHNLTLNLGAIEDCDTTYFNNRKLGSTGYGTPRYWEAPRSYLVPSSFVRYGEPNTIAVRVFDDGGTGGLVGGEGALTLRPAAEALPREVPLAGPWKYHLEAVLEPDPVRLAHANSPTVLYNGMIDPLTPYRIRGVIWYQGESNHTRGQAYRTLFPALIADWRSAWDQGSFPFYFVQIAPFNYTAPDSAPVLREAQLQALSVPNTGMVVTTDVAEPDDIHPRNKQAVGRRLALLALAQTYGRDVPCSGPLYRSMRVEDGAIRVFFDHADGGLVAQGGPLTHFAIAGADRVFTGAEARIEGETVIVSSPGVPEPAAVRFGWCNAPTPNLFNRAGLPASPFRTDDWADAVNAPPSAPMSEHADLDATVAIDLNEVLVDDFLGVGVEWSAYPWWDLSDADWEKVFRRLEFMQLRFSRVMLDAFWYCQGFDDAGEPIYTWDSRFMVKLYRLLDWCQRNNAVVILGEWGRPNGKDLDLAADDPRWTRIIADCVEHLVRRKGYTCIRYYNIINEPHGSWTGVTWDEWYAAITNLQAEFTRRGLLEQVKLAAPDGDRNFTTRCLKYPALRRLTGAYDEHWYVYAADVERGLLELHAREQLRQMAAHDPGKPYVLGELGLVDDKTAGDQQLHVYDVWYGVSMGDAAIQLLRGGLSGFIAWDLDDSMHFCADGGESMNALSDVLPDDAYQRRKIWGFWSILGAENGMPDDEHMRPWFYPWSILSRAFPPGCATVATEETAIDGLRVAAARIPADGGDHLSWAVANNNPWPRRIRLHVPHATRSTALDVYVYADTNHDNVVDNWPRVVDAEGRDIFPSPTRTIEDVDLTNGVTLSLPARSIAIVTTLPHSTVVDGRGRGADPQRTGRE